MSDTENADRGPPRNAGPTDIHDPLVRIEARKAFVWLGVAALFALAVVLSGWAVNAMIDRIAARRG